MVLNNDINLSLSEILYLLSLLIVFYIMIGKSYLNFYNSKTQMFYLCSLCHKNHVKVQH